MKTRHCDIAVSVGHALSTWRLPMQRRWEWATLWNLTKWLKGLIATRHNNRSPYKANRRNNQATDCQSRRANRDATALLPN
jgi:hypothetical protein